MGKEQEMARKLSFSWYDECRFPCWSHTQVLLLANSSIIIIVIIIIIIIISSSSSSSVIIIIIISSIISTIYHCDSFWLS